MSQHLHISCLTGHRDRKGVETRGSMVPQTLGHRGSRTSQIWDTRCHGSRNLGTRGSTAPPNLRLPWTRNTTPGPDTTQNPDHEVLRPLPTPEPPPGASNPGAVPGRHRPLLVTGRRHLGERRSGLLISMVFPPTPMCGRREERQPERPPRVLQRPFPPSLPAPAAVSMGTKMAAAGERRGRGARRGHTATPGTRTPGTQGSLGLSRGRLRERGRDRDRGEGGERGPGGSAGVAARRDGVTRGLEGQRVIP